VHVFLLVFDGCYAAWRCTKADMIFFLVHVLKQDLELAVPMHCTKWQARSRSLQRHLFEKELLIKLRSNHCDKRCEILMLPLEGQAFI
jgi:hypothetical protein